MTTLARPRAEPVAPSPSSSAAALDRLWSIHGSALVEALEKNIGQLDERLRTSPKPSSRVPEAREPAWLRNPGALLRARAGSEARVRWLRARASGGEAPPTFTEPTAEDMVRQFVAGARFAAVDRLGCLAGHAFAHVSSPAERRAESELVAVRVKAGGVLRSCYAGPIDRLPSFRSWAALEARLDHLATREAALVARATRLGQTGQSLAAAMSPRVRAIRDEVGVEPIARAILEHRGLGERDPLERHPAVVAFEARLRQIDDTLSTNGPGGEERARVRAELRAALDRLAAERAARSRPILEALSWEAERMMSCPAGWRELGEMADASPGAFPDGFAERWLGAAAGAMLEAGAEGVLDLLEQG